MRKIGGTVLAALILVACATGVVRAEPSEDGVRSLGLGLQWTHQQLGGGLNDENPGGVSARYWFNDRWGVDAGIGAGLPDASTASILLVDFSAEGMYALKRSGKSVLYVDALAMPALARVNGGKNGFTTTQNGQNGYATELSLSAGAGFETALSDFPRVRWFLQLNPLSFSEVYPAVGGQTPGSKAFDFLGSNTIVSLGFHYQL